MATNGNSNQNDVPRLLNQISQIESDSTNIRLRSDLHKKETITCLSCGKPFFATSNLEIFEHYSEKLHTHYLGDCLYCGGKVHKYQRTQGQDKFFHNCSRWKCGEEK